jgi:hypothetical protein
LLDRGFFVFAGFSTLWLGGLLFVRGLTIEWTYWAYFVIFWLVVAYLGLPRLHRILSHIYVPDYFIGRARTSDGLLGDPINIGIRGSETQLHQAMLSAGWTLADEVTVRSSWRIVRAVLHGKSYPKAPVSALFLFGRRQDFSYQKEVDGSPKKRHHIRFWHCPKGWLLPGGHQADWLASATYDTSAGLSWFTLQVTHRIDENTDIERDFVVDSVLNANRMAKVDLIKDFSTGYHSRNGGGDMIITDGDLPILELNQVKSMSSLPRRSGVILDSTLSEDMEIASPIELGEALWKRRPLQLVSAAVLAVAVLAIEVASIVQGLLFIFTDESKGLDETTAYLVAGVLAVSFITVIIETILVVYVLKGRNWARMGLLALASLFIINTGVEFFVYREPITFGNSLVSVSLHIGLLLALSSDAARRFTYRATSKIVKK